MLNKIFMLSFSFIQLFVFVLSINLFQGILKDSSSSRWLLSLAVFDDTACGSFFPIKEQDTKSPRLKWLRWKR